ncbi:DNA phosphorothioation system sulfurtransferase DndC [uncultured Catenibacterium sp.]|uniref:DNA phosphorothioation system sulfurtransferase DndC n=1 Tax=uncultured Catenibacterium sp. TaxID=286142 RepID=UPI0025F6D420|nr:DNA phosphorothioation system sulfurtransferase DndC [uncultured Catenibacterium sp.]
MGLLDEIKNYNDLAVEAKERIERVYLDDDRPWVVGYSGGKDSTTALQLIIETLVLMKNKNIKLNKKIYVISSDTMVETPLIISSIANNLEQIQRFVDDNHLPVETHLVRPSIDNTFWVNLIGKGYPAPNQSFRWCTDRMKIEPTNQFIKNKVSDYGEVIVVLGVRLGESTSRDRVLKKHDIRGKEIMQHSTLANAFTFAPIKYFDVDDVWNYLLNNKSPWGANNEELFKLYSDSNSNECPLIIDKETKERTGSCGNSRFGCWVCTVVSEDKALTGFVENGENWLKPLLKYRNDLTKNRDNRSMRMKRRSNGSVYTISVKEKFVQGERTLIIPKKSGREKVTITVKKNSSLKASNDDIYTVIESKDLRNYIRHNRIDLDDGEIPNLLIHDEFDHYNMLGLGPYTFKARAKMLADLLKLQKEVNDAGHKVQLISDDELREIRRQWLKRGLIEDSVSKIYSAVYNKDLVCEKNDIELISSSQYEILKEICDEQDVYVDPLIKMLNLEKDNTGSRVKKNVLEQINEILNEDYLHMQE